MAHRSGAGSVASREMLSTRNATTFRVTIHAIVCTLRHTKMSTSRVCILVTKDTAFTWRQLNMKYFDWQWTSQTPIQGGKNHGFNEIWEIAPFRGSGGQKDPPQPWPGPVTYRIWSPPIVPYCTGKGGGRICHFRTLETRKSGCFVSAATKWGVFRLSWKKTRTRTSFYTKNVYMALFCEKRMKHARISSICKKERTY